MKIILFTSSFPYGKGEQFLETEIKYLSEKFDKIVIIPATYGNSNTLRFIPENVEVKNPILVSKFKRVFNLRFINLLLKPKSFSIIIQELYSSIKKGQFRLFLAEFNILYSTLGESFVKELLKNTTKHDIIYFYWGHGQSFILPFIKNVSAKKVFRVHRGDLYEYLNNNYLPFRKHQIEACDYICPISLDGCDYLSKRYPFGKEKIKLFRLGTLNHEYISPNKENDFFHIVSCSSMIEVKRVHLIIEVLNKIKNKKIKWTHFGEGYLMDSLLQKAEQLNENIIVDFKGFTPNTEILEFYKDEQIDLFVNVSSSEGIPVSIMEAISYGIPVIATDVGGTAEAIEKQSGILIDKDFEIDDVSNIVLKIIEKQITFDRKVVKGFWNERFNANINYSDFSTFLKELGNKN